MLKTLTKLLKNTLPLLQNFIKHRTSSLKIWPILQVKLLNWLSYRKNNVKNLNKIKLVNKKNKILTRIN